jgi:hypothetical protein
MPTQEMTLNEVRSRGFEALIRELGPLGYTRFVQQFHSGEGNHTESRREFVDRVSASELEEMLRSRRTGAEAAAT